METEGRGFPDMLRSSTEEMILSSFIENPIGSCPPNMEMLGYRTTLQICREDSEELFNAWLMNGEIPGFSSVNGTNHTRQMSRKISSEIIAFGNQQTGTAQKTNTEDNSLSMLNDHSHDIQGTIRNAAEKSIQATNFLLSKAWFHNSQPMTRNRSSELRRRYAAMQNSQMQAITESQNNSTIPGVEKEPTKLRNEFCDAPIVETGTQVRAFMSLSNSATSPFDTLSVAAVDPISSAVSMLKGSLENKRLAREVTSNVISNIQPEVNLICNQGIQNEIYWPTDQFHMVSSISEQNSMNSKVEISLEPNTEAFLTPANQFRTGTVSREPSQSGSSSAVLAFAFDACDDLANSAQTNSICESSKRPIGGRNWNHKSVDYGENMLQNNVKDDRKKGNLIRLGSVNSSVISVDKGDPTKKRRVERSRKMAEAKERSLAPALPSDMQAVLKRCETLEKEVRSLKLNLSFMNRKDSDQTKHIEELQKENEELKDEKRRLVEEIERIYPETGSW
ncbi:protein CYCLOPS-like [Curcuma longa]|uniref:protein CYCLOPS-like n=1 Tax=Curcuma longa TaxID=136217 RepID=UPI003D9DF850